jgi:uncharacterized protein (DUF427 family)
MMTDYPPPLPQVNQTAHVPWRIRAVLNGRVVLDTASALYVWEWERYPQCYIPIATSTRLFSSTGGMSRS